MFGDNDDIEEQTRGIRFSSFQVQLEKNIVYKKKDRAGRRRKLVERRTGRDALRTDIHAANRLARYSQLLTQ